MPALSLRAGVCGEQSQYYHELGAAFPGTGSKRIGARDNINFGIVQGSTYPDLREKAAQDLVALDFDGYAVGGLSVGEPDEELYSAIEIALPVLPKDKPRYAMGLGQPNQLLELIGRGVDMFDCVLPTRVAQKRDHLYKGGDPEHQEQKVRERSAADRGRHASIMPRIQPCLPAPP